MNYSVNLINSVKKDNSALVLIASNLITIILAVVYNWNLMTLLWSYWLQSIVIGLFNFLRIISLKDYSAENSGINGRNAPANNFTKIFAAFFFAFHYGFFHLVYAFFLGFFSFGLFFSGSLSPDFSFVFLSGIIFFFNHLFSFLYFKGKTEKKRNIGALMFYPYARIIPMHLTIIFGGIFFVSGSPLILVFFLGLKSTADLIMHLIEHKEQLFPKVVSKTA